MFRIDEDYVIDATLNGSAARFINHSCDPNCFSKIVSVDGTKHIVIFALNPSVSFDTTIALALASVARAICFRSCSLFLAK